VRKDITLIERDVRSILELPEEVNWIIHAAGNPDNRLHVSDPLRTMQVITQGTQAILEAATRLPNLKRILNISSGLVYGTQPWEVDAIAESAAGAVDCAAVGSAYAEAKRYAETLCAAYRNQHRLPIVNARPFAFIGPYQLLDRPWAVNNFIRDGLLGGPIRILGDGQTVRSYMYPSEMALWLLTILLQGAVGQSYNVGSPEGVTLQQLAEKIAVGMPGPIKILSRTGGEAGLRRSKFVPDVSLAQRTLGLAVRMTLDAAIRRTLGWHRGAREFEAVRHAQQETGDG
jgi:dTDP-glucose 4,6-dehydratase